MDKNNLIVLVTGGFDPIHSGHISLFNYASHLGRELVVGINSDEWLIRKKGFFFLPFNERKVIIENLKMVEKVISWDDKDNTATGAIQIVLNQLSGNEAVIFANGGDRTIGNIPEISSFQKNNKVKFKFGIGGNTKQNSSSLILDKYKKNFKP